MKRLAKKAALLAVCLVLAAALLGGCAGKDNTVTVASKQFTENILLGEMYAQLIEAKTDLKVERKLNLGGTSVCFPAIEKGEVDMYFEYTGTGYNEILKLTPEYDPQVVYDTVKAQYAEKYGIRWFTPIGINNTFALGMSRAFAESRNLKTLSDLSPISGELRFGANHLFYTREQDGYDGMVADYQFSFKDPMTMDTSFLYDAIEQNKLDVIVVYATDAALKRVDMVVLQDDKQYFPPYYGAPIVREEVLKAHPELEAVFETLAGQIDDVTMQALNFEVEGNNRTVEDVAKQFLTDKGFI